MTLIENGDSNIVMDTKLPSKSFIRKALMPNVWGKGNKVLYDLCRKYPCHKDEGEILAKIWLIGRSYSASIERRKNKKELMDGDSFYEDIVAKEIKGSDIDRLIKSVRKYKKTTLKNAEEIACVHHKVTMLFNKITAQNKRSLASKYLHFHLPNLFFLYDSRAQKAIREYIDVRRIEFPKVVDKEYYKFLIKCIMLREKMYKRHDVVLSPRELDNLLLKF